MGLEGRGPALKASMTIGMTKRTKHSYFAGQTGSETRGARYSVGDFTVLIGRRILA